MTQDDVPSEPTTEQADGRARDELERKLDEQFADAEDDDDFDPDSIYYDILPDPGPPPMPSGG